MGDDKRLNALCLPKPNLTEQPKGGETDEQGGDRPEWVEALDNPKYIH